MLFVQSNNWNGMGEAASGLLAGYDAQGFYCELFGAPGGSPEAPSELLRRIDRFSLKDLKRRSKAVERELYNLGITFTVYMQKEQIDRILPFDAIPRLISANEWETLEAGVIQRVTAINLFLQDIYGDAKILKEGIVPTDLVVKNSNYVKEMEEIKVPHAAYSNICGTDLVRGSDGQMYVLEDNARTPSGVSYVVENRHLTQRAFPDLIKNMAVRPVSNYGQLLVESLGELAPASVIDPQVVLLSPGIYNSAYFEHVFLAREMGVPLVEGRDLIVDEKDRVHMKSIKGLEPVDVIYRRIDDDFLDPEVFNTDSLLGVPGLMRAYAKGHLALANAVGCGVADDKAIYAYMPRIIKYYLDQDAILPNVDTHICAEQEGLDYTLAHLNELVVKPVGASGGYGVVIGPKASKRELAEVKRLVKAKPADYISQPMISLSVSPTLTNRGIEPRHVDLRPFAVTGKSSWVLPGGLSRVAMKRGSLIVNSSQGGGSKDTWVLE